MTELSIKIKIGDREYPMKVAASEEERVRHAARLINDRLKQFSQVYGITDKQDLLAMAAFDIQVEGIKKDARLLEEERLVGSHLNELHQILSDTHISDQIR